MKSELAFASIAVMVLMAGCTAGEPSTDAGEVAQPTDEVAGARLTDEDARAIVEQMNEEWDAAVLAGDFDAASGMYTEDAIRMQPDMPALVGREAIRAWMEGQAATYTFEGSNEILEVRALSPDWILMRGRGTFTATPRAGGKGSYQAEKWLTVVQRQPDGSWKWYRDAGSSDVGHAVSSAKERGAARDSDSAPVSEAAERPPIVFEPIPAPMHIYYYPATPMAVQLIAAPDPGHSPERPDRLFGVGHLDSRCIHEIRILEGWQGDDEAEALLPTWAIAPFDSVSGNTTEPILAFEPDECPAHLFEKSWPSEDILAWAGSVIGKQLEDSLGTKLEMHPLKGASWTLDDGRQQTWMRMAFGKPGAPWWEARHDVMAAIDHGGDREPRLFDLRGPRDGFAGVPFALIDMEDDGIPEVFAWDWIPQEGGYQLEGVNIIGSEDGFSYRVLHRVAGWRTSTH